MKRVRDTSIASLRELADQLPRLECVVFNALKSVERQGLPAPTAYELFKILESHDAAFDLNSVRPRISGMQDKLLVERVERRRCSVSGKTAWTWRTVTQKPVERPLEDAFQETFW